MPRPVPAPRNSRAPQPAASRLLFLGRLLALGLALAWLGSARAQGAGTPLLLEMWINGHATGKLGNFTEHNGALSATREELLELGLIVPAGAKDDSLPLAQLPGVSYRIEVRTQRLHVVASAAALQPNVLSMAANLAGPSALPMQRGSGAVLNYDAVATQNVGGRGSLSALLDGRWFGAWGVASSGVLLSTASSAPSHAIRLDSTFTHTDEARLLKYQLGDFITDGLSWTRPVRLGGFQMSTDFSLRPDLITYPVLRTEGSAAVPSTVDVLVNGVRQLTREVPPGPFEIRQIPVTTGAGEVAVSVRDALGRTTVQNLPFYGTTRLLEAGRVAHSLQVGALRRSYGLRSNDYRSLATVGSVRYGMTDWLTLEGHGEYAAGTSVAGGGAQFALGTLGLASVSLAGSSAASGSGTQAGAAIERVSRNFSVSASIVAASPRYRDIAAPNESLGPRLTRRISLSLPSRSLGNFGVTYVALKRGDSIDPNTGMFAGAGGGETRLLSLVHSKSITDRLQVFTTAYTGSGQMSANRGIFISLSYIFQNGASTSVSASQDGKRAGLTVQGAKMALQPGDFGWQGLVTQGPYSRAMGEGEYRSQYAEARLGFDSLGSNTSVRASVRGAVAATAGQLSLSAPIPGAFGVVDTDGAAGVPVFYENQPAGVTDSRGFLLLPRLRAYDANRVSIDPLGVAADINLASPTLQVRPADRAGVHIRFPMKPNLASLVTLVDERGTALPLGTEVRLNESRDPAATGHDGQVYLTRLRAENSLVAKLPSGERCRASFEFQPAFGEISKIGMLTCRPIM